MKNLKPAFVVLAIGYLLALLVFLVEKIAFYYATNLKFVGFILLDFKNALK